MAGAYKDWPTHASVNGHDGCCNLQLLASNKMKLEHISL